MRALRNFGGNLRIQTEKTHKGRQQVEEQCSCSLAMTTISCKPRTRSTVTIWHLPDHILVHIMRGMHIRDVLSFKAAHPYFSDIVDNSSVWAQVSFLNSWPCESNVHHFVKAAASRNFEAAIKLAVAYLYKEGLTGDAASNASMEAAHYLCLAETLTPRTFPFFWIFIRPPWSPDGTCCKVQTYNHITKMLDKKEMPDVTFGVGLIMKLQRLSLQYDSKAEEQKYFRMATNQNSAAAVFFTLMDDIVLDEVDKAKELENLRVLRQVASCDILEAKLNLIKFYAHGQFGGVSPKVAQEYVQDFFSSSNPSGIHLVFKAARTSDVSRYILIDWLVEVAGMKDFSAHVLYFAVSMFDRFLQKRRIQRSQVQLLGVAAMVVSSRFLGFDILTIREAAWLTDNSYTYHDVVRMMGELVATLRGNLRALTIQDYMKVLLSLMNDTGFSAMLVEYIAMLCLLQSEMGQYSPAEIAASCMLLSRLLQNQIEPWPIVLKEWTGFTQDYLSLCTFHIYNKCLLEGSEMEYRDTKLQSVKLRYADPNRYAVSDIEIIGPRELCRRLGVTKLVNHGKNTKAIRFRNTDELILSPRRGVRPDYQRNLNLPFEDELVDRNHAATPPMKNAYAMDGNISGYEGDMEDESDEYYSDKSDIFLELMEDSELSSVTNPFDDSQDWDGEASQTEDCSDEADTEVIASASDEDAPGAPVNAKESQTEAKEKFACLSSMCHSGTNLACHSSHASSSPCISNCSCKLSYTLASSDSGNGSLASASGLSQSSPSLLSPSSSSSQCSLNCGDVRSCIPCGSISAISKSLRRNRFGACSIAHDISADQEGKFCHNNTVQEQYMLRKSQSSHELTSPSATSDADSESGNFCPHLFMNQAFIDLLKSMEFGENSHSESIPNQANSTCDAACHSSDLKQHIETSGHTSGLSQGRLCNNSMTFYTPSQHFKHQEGSSMLSLSSFSPASSAYSTPVVRPRSSTLTKQDASHPRPTSMFIHEAQNQNVKSCSDFTPPSGFNFEGLYDDLSNPATPESVTDLQQSSMGVDGWVRDYPAFSSSPFSEASPSQNTSKRARLEYTESFSTSVNTAHTRLGLTWEPSTSYKSDFSESYQCLENLSISESQCDKEQQHCTVHARSSLLRKRKGC